MSEPKQATLEGWAMVELMGHQREVGYVTTEAYGQVVMFRIDTPALPEREYVLARPEWCGQTYAAKGSRVKRAALLSKSRLVSPGSLYAINPCTEEAAKLAIDQISSRELILIEAPPQNLLAEPEEPKETSADDDDDEENPFEDREPF